MNRSEPSFEAMKSEARKASRVAYAPYSRFRVGAAVAGSNGMIISGCNVENASFGLTLCAERNAIAAAVAAGIKEIRSVLIYVSGARAASPCGACRQVILELMDPAARIISCCDSADVREWTVAEILPDPFQAEEHLAPLDVE